MIHPPTISAPDAVVRAWREEAARAMATARRPDDPYIVDVLRFVPREVAELITHMGEALSHAAGILLASVANATPGMRDELDGELKALVAQVTAEQCRDRGTPGECPIPEPDGSPHPCTCGPTGRATCAGFAAEIDAVPMHVPAGDDGCEGGTA